MEGSLGPYSVKENPLYAMSGPAMKIMMSVLQKGLKSDENGDITYDPKMPGYMTQMEKDLEGRVSRQVIDQYIDSLTDEKFLTESPMGVEKVEPSLMAHGYRIHPDLQKKMVDYFKIVHDIKKIELTI